MRNSGAALQNLYTERRGPERMATPAVPDSDFRYLDRKSGALMRTRTELSVAQMLSFLGHEYEYGHELDVGGERFRIDFKTARGLIEVIDGREDAEKYGRARAALERAGGPSIMAVGRPGGAARMEELGDVAFCGPEPQPEAGSIFMEDESFTFDYAHVLPLVEKCSILHGHTSSVMVELAGRMEDGLLVDFGVAKGIIRRAISALDHKFFVNERYVARETPTHYSISFEGPRGAFDIRVPRDTAYLLRGEATVENLSTEIISLLAPGLPANVDAVGVYVYEGYNKGSHAISSLAGARR